MLLELINNRRYEGLKWQTCVLIISFVEYSSRDSLNALLMRDFLLARF